MDLEEIASRSVSTDSSCSEGTKACLQRAGLGRIVGELGRPKDSQGSQPIATGIKKPIIQDTSSSEDGSVDGRAKMCEERDEIVYIASVREGRHMRSRNRNVRLKRSKLNRSEERR